MRRWVFLAGLVTFIAMGSAAVNAAQGPAKPGATCNLGGAARSAAIGTVFDGMADTPGPTGNDVNNVFIIRIITSTNTGPNSVVGFLMTTFNHENWYQSLLDTPGPPMVVNLGNDAVGPTAPLSADLIDHLLTIEARKPLDVLNRTAATSLQDLASRLRQPGAISRIDPCFDAPWDGKYNK